MRNRIFSLSLTGLLLLSAAGTTLDAQSRASKVRYISYEEARPVLASLAEALPAGLRAANPRDISSIWANWVVRRDSEIRARLIQGDEDSIVNLLLFGTSFTRRPRITLRDLSEIGEKIQPNSGTNSIEAKAFINAIQSRADDLIQAMTTPGKNERILFGRRLVMAKGHDFSTEDGRSRVRHYLLSNLSRVLSEHASYARVLESAKLQGDPSSEFAERSKLYATRGLSSDTSLPPNLALERSLSSMKAKGMLAPGSVRRVGIIGPGLDFTDKQDGYDFYPQQTIQPFALVDTLLRLGLSRLSDLRVTTFDLSERVNDHLRRATTSARRGAGYTIQLAMDPQWQWKPDLVDYWSRFGDRIATPVSPAAATSGLEVKIRAIKVRASVVSIINAEDTNIVLQIPNESGFDLLIATNIFVYYDVFEQSLALVNVDKMLRAGGFLLSNNALLELPGSRVRSVGYETVVYSDRPNDGDHIVWYQRVVDK